MASPSFDNMSCNIDNIDLVFIVFVSQYGAQCMKEDPESVFFFFLNIVLILITVNILVKIEEMGDFEQPSFYSS